jgi:hypothetical protein
VRAHQGFDREFQLLGRGFARQRLAKSSREVSIRTPDESIVFLEERSHPGMVVLAEEVGDDLTARDSTVDRMIE